MTLECFAVLCLELNGSIFSHCRRRVGNPRTSQLTRGSYSTGAVRCGVYYYRETVRPKSKDMAPTERLLFTVGSFMWVLWGGAGNAKSVRVRLTSKAGLNNFGGLWHLGAALVVYHLDVRCLGLGTGDLEHEP